MNVLWPWLDYLSPCVFPLSSAAFFLYMHGVGGKFLRNASLRQDTILYASMLFYGF